MADAYDPSESEGRSRPSHLTRKDFRVILVAVIILVVLMTPIYGMLKSQRDKHLCKQNFGQIYKSMVAYAIDNNDRFPPLFVENNGEPAFPNGDGRPYTWMSLIQGGLNRRASFQCPSAAEDEHVWNLPNNSDHQAFASDIGMYKPWAGWNMTMISDPDRSVLVTETSNAGSNDTFDPHPYSHRVDGMAITWDTGNGSPTNLSEFVTRLAFKGTKEKRFVRSGETRHSEGNHAISVGGSLIHLKPDAARIQRISATDTEIVGHWAIR